MITGKFSALKGFGLFSLFIISVISFAGCVVSGSALAIVCGTVLMLSVWAVVLFLFSFWSGARYTEGTQIVLKLSFKKK